MNALTPTGGNAPLLPRDMNAAMQLATMMSQGKLVPAHLQRSPGDCLMVIEQAMRWGMSPFAVAQSTSVIQGKMMFEGKLVSAALHSSGILTSRLEYEFGGAGDARAVTVRGTLRGEDKPREIVVTLKEAKTSNQMWTKQPDQQLVYFGTRAWARRHAPEVMLGVYSPEEFDAPAPAAFAGTTIEAKPEAPSMAQQIGDELPPQAQSDYTLTTKQGTRVFETPNQWVAAWTRLISNCKAADALDKLEAARTLNKASLERVAQIDPASADAVAQAIVQALYPQEAEMASAAEPVIDNAPENEAA